jgi:hypothetical protein
MTRSSSFPTLSRHVPLLAALAAVAGGCEQPGAALPPDARVTVDTIDGIPHVVSGSRGAWVQGGAWKVPSEGRVVLGARDRVGSAGSGLVPVPSGGAAPEGPPREGAEREGAGSERGRAIGGVAVADGGRVYVGYRDVPEVRVFSRAGEFERRFGRAGTEPGHIASVRALYHAPEGIGLVDDVLGRVTVFSRDGEVVRWFHLARPQSREPVQSDQNQPAGTRGGAILGFDDQGRFYEGTTVSASTDGEGHGVAVYAAGATVGAGVGAGVDAGVHAGVHAEVDTVQVLTSVEGRGAAASASPALAVGPDGSIYVARGDTYEIAVLSPEGDTVRVLRRALQPRPGGLTIVDLRVDRIGNLWVGAPWGEGWRSREWAVHSPDGRYLGPVAAPLMAVTDIGRDYMAGIETDADGVEWAVIYPLQK